jgi:hypothetical protein
VVSLNARGMSFQNHWTICMGGGRASVRRGVVAGASAASSTKHRGVDAQAAAQGLHHAMVCC